MTNLNELFEIDPDDGDEQLAIALAESDSGLLEDLVRMRLAKGLTQQDVADRIGRHQTAVSQFERLGSDPHLSTVRRYARAIGARVTHSVVDSSSAAERTISHPARVLQWETGAENYFTASAANRAPHEVLPSDEATWVSLGSVSACAHG